MNNPFQYLRERKRFHSGEEAEEILGVPVLGLIPHIEEGRPLVTDWSTYSPSFESYRSLRVNLFGINHENPLKSLIVTSSVAGEGTSTIAFNLALCLTLTNKRVVIVDANERRPTLHKLLNAPSKPGLSNLLVEQHILKEVTHPAWNLNFIPVGMMCPNPTELLATAKMTQIIAELGNRYDVVLFDCPPLLVAPDALVLAPQADTTLLVVSYNETRVSAVLRAMGLLARAKANVAGTVLNRVRNDPWLPFGDDYKGYADTRVR